MSRVILLDSFPAGLITNPKPSPEQSAISEWLADCLQAEHRVILPEIIDYEMRVNYSVPKNKRTCKT